MLSSAGGVATQAATDLVTWGNLGTLALVVLCLNVAILDLFIASRMRVVGFRSTAAALAAAATALMLAAGFLFSEIFAVVDPPRYWWRTALAAHLIANSVARYGMHVRLLLPAAAVAERFSNGHRGGGMDR